MAFRDAEVEAEQCGDPIERPPSPPVNPTLLKTSASMAAAAANVTTARFTPRTRRAGKPMRMPIGTTVSAAMISEIGNGMPYSLA